MAQTLLRQLLGSTGVARGARLGLAIFSALLAVTPPTRAERERFAAPALRSEPLSPNQPVPFVPPLAGMQVRNWRLDVDAIEPTLPAAGMQVMGPTVVRIDYAYADQPRLTPRQVLGTYKRSLTAAGWKVYTSADAPAVLVAHYLRPSRNLWLKLYADAQALHLCLSEPAAHARAADLRQALATKGKVTVYGVAFAPGRASLIAEAEPVLAELRELLAQSPQLKLAIRVHDEDVFPVIYDHLIAPDRAERVKRWLTQHGVAAERLIVSSTWESIPVQSNRPLDWRIRNRRVELVTVP